MSISATARTHEASSQAQRIFRLLETYAVQIHTRPGAYNPFVPAWPFPTQNSALKRYWSLDRRHGRYRVLDSCTSWSSASAIPLIHFEVGHSCSQSWAYRFLHISGRRHLRDPKAGRQGQGENRATKLAPDLRGPSRGHETSGYTFYGVVVFGKETQSRTAGRSNSSGPIPISISSPFLTYPTC